MYKFVLAASVFILSNTVLAKKLIVKKIEIIKGKTEEKVVSDTKTTFHGKKVTTQKTMKINSKSSDNKYVTQYLESIKNIISSSSKNISKDISGKSFAKIQIQKSGAYDVLYIEGDNPKVQTWTQNLMNSIEKMPKIPDDAGQNELQIKIPMQIK